MATVADEIRIIIRAETDKAISELIRMNSQLGTIKKSTDTFANSLNALMGFAVFNYLKEGFQKVIKAASDLEEGSSKFAVVFSRSLDKANKSVEELTTTYGMSQREAMDYMSTLQAMTMSMGYASDEALKFSTGLTKLAIDMSSFYNISRDDAFVKIRAGIVGETEPLKQLGIVVDEGRIKMYAYTNGIAAAGAELTTKQKVMARYLAIMDQTKTSQGDFIRTSDSWANSQRILSARIEDTSAQIGNRLLPVVKDAGNALLKAFTKENVDMIMNIGGVIVDASIGFYRFATADIVNNVMALYQAFQYLRGEIEGTNIAIAGVIEKGLAGGIKAGLAYTPESSQGAGGALPKGNAAEQKKKMNAEIAKIQQEFYTQMGDMETANMIAEQERYMEQQAMMQELRIADQATIEQAELVHQQNVQNIQNQAAATRVQKYTQAGQQALSIVQGWMNQIQGIMQAQAQNEAALLDNKYKKTKKILDMFITDDEQRKKAQELLDAYYEMRKMHMQRREFERNKIFQIANVWINAASGIMSAWAQAMILGPIAGPIVAGIMTGMLLGLAGAQTAMISTQQAPMMAQGGIIPGSPSGQLIRAGEGGKSEAIIPFENEEAMGRMGMGNTINFYVNNLYATEDVPETMAIAIDNALYKLQKSRGSVFAEVI